MRCSELLEDVFMISIKLKSYWKVEKWNKNRIEYKEDLNHSDIEHTICAYANDVAGVYGGYLVIGVKQREDSYSAACGLAQ